MNPKTFLGMALITVGAVLAVHFIGYMIGLPEDFINAVLFFGLGFWMAKLKLED